MLLLNYTKIKDHVSKRGPRCYCYQPKELGEHTYVVYANFRTNRSSSKLVGAFITGRPAHDKTLVSLRGFWTLIVQQTIHQIHIDLGGYIHFRNFCGALWNPCKFLSSDQLSTFFRTIRFQDWLHIWWMHIWGTSHYIDVIMGAMASQTTNLMIV